MQAEEAKCWLLLGSVWRPAPHGSGSARRTTPRASHAPGSAPTHDVTRSPMESQVPVGAASGACARTAAQQKRGGTCCCAVLRVGAGRRGGLGWAAHGTAMRIAIALSGGDPHLERRPAGRGPPAELHTACSWSSSKYADWGGRDTWASGYLSEMVSNTQFILALMPLRVLRGAWQLTTARKAAQRVKRESDLSMWGMRCMGSVNLQYSGRCAAPPHHGHVGAPPPPPVQEASAADTARPIWGEHNPTDGVSSRSDTWACAVPTLPTCLRIRCKSGSGCRPACVDAVSLNSHCERIDVSERLPCQERYQRCCRA